MATDRALERYAGMCASLATELEESLSNEEIEGLRQTLSEWGKERWDAWRLENMNEISEFAAASRSVREKKAKWRTLRPLLTAAAVQHYGEAWFLLNAVSFDLVAGMSYRVMAAQAGRMVEEIRQRKGMLTLPSGFDGRLVGILLALK